MDATLAARIARIREDRVSGSSALLARGVELLRAIAAERAAVDEAAAELCRAQPAMAGFRALAAVVRSARDPSTAIERFARQIARAPAAIARNACDVLALRHGDGPLRLVTCSASHAVEVTVRAAAERFEVILACAEGRPHLEGRGLATRLAAAGVNVEFYTDAAVGTALASAEALLVGADALGPDCFINKVGTGALCALAHAGGVVVYVLAGREKRLEAADMDGLTLGRGEADEVWPAAADGVRVCNPYFERVSLAHVSAVIMDTTAVAL